MHGIRLKAFANSLAILGLAGLMLPSAAAAQSAADGFTGNARLIVCFTEAMGKFEDADFPTPYDEELAKLEKEAEDLSTRSLENPSLLPKIIQVAEEEGRVSMKADEIRQRDQEAKAAEICGGYPEGREPSTVKTQ